MSDTVKIAMLEQKIADLERVGKHYQSSVIQSLEALKVMLDEDEIEEAKEYLNDLTEG